MNDERGMKDQSVFRLSFIIHRSSLNEDGKASDS
jgi:hypothetical protein